MIWKTEYSRTLANVQEKAIQMHKRNEFAAKDKNGDGNRLRIIVAREWIQKSKVSLWNESAKTANLSITGECLRSAWHVTTGNYEAST
jgi:hypothetical protein